MGDFRGVIYEIFAERRRQIEVEGWTPEHDDRHDCRELAAAAEGYVLAASLSVDERQQCFGDGEIPPYWPFDISFWRPTTPRRDLIKAAALIVAEIERLDRKKGSGE